MLLWKAVVLEVGVQAPKRSDLMKILAKALKIRVKMAPNVACVAVMNINYQRYPQTEQFTTAKICGNALKQGNRTHAVLRQRSPQLQKYKTARMSRRIAVDQKVCGWDGGHPGLTVWNLPTTHTVDWECAWSTQEIFVFYYVAVVCTITKEK